MPIGFHEPISVPSSRFIHPMSSHSKTAKQFLMDLTCLDHPSILAWTVLPVNCDGWRILSPVDKPDPTQQLSKYQKSNHEAGRLGQPGLLASCCFYLHVSCPVFASLEFLERKMVMRDSYFGLIDTRSLAHLFRTGSISRREEQ